MTDFLYLLAWRLMFAFGVACIASAFIVVAFVSVTLVLR